MGGRGKRGEGVGEWCADRLTVGLYTTLRLLYYRSDTRFSTGLNQNRQMLLQVFILQGVWIMYQMLPLLVLNSVPPEVTAVATWHNRSTNPAGFMMWVLIMGWFWLGMYSVLRGSCLETLADWQLTKWRWARDHGKHTEAFCRDDLWNRR